MNAHDEAREEALSTPETPLTPETPPSLRQADLDNVPPPPISTNRGPMDQSVPDVATGSTPVTRRDD